MAKSKVKAQQANAKITMQNALGQIVLIAFIYHKCSPQAIFTLRILHIAF
jgi:hypothetical protein